MYRMWKSYPEGKTCEVKLIQGSEPVEMQKTARQYGLQHECGISLLHLAPGPPQPLFSSWVLIWGPV